MVTKVLRSPKENRTNRYSTYHDEEHAETGYNKITLMSCYSYNLGYDCIRAWDTWKDMIIWDVKPDVMAYTTMMKVMYNVLFVISFFKYKTNLIVCWTI